MSTASVVIPTSRRPALPNAVLGMLIFIATEVMFFTALISAFLVIRRERVTWALPAGIQLPVLTTGLNTLVLIASGAFLLWAGREFARHRTSSAQSWLLRSFLFGGVFVGVQGYEWLQLGKFGLSATEHIFGALFFLIIGSHALHVLAGLVGLGMMYWKLRRNTLRLPNLRAMQMYWSLVVLIWPILYTLVYF